jgi:hypothetical protein
VRHTHLAPVDREYFGRLWVAHINRLQRRLLPGAMYNPVRLP